MILPPEPGSSRSNRLRQFGYRFQKRSEVCVHIPERIATHAVEATRGRITPSSSLLVQLFSSEPGSRTHMVTQSWNQAVVTQRRGAFAGRIARGRKRVIGDQSTSCFSTIEMKEVKLSAGSTAHQFRIFSREIFEYIECQSSRRRDLRFLLEAPMRCQGIDTQRCDLEEPRD